MPRSCWTSRERRIPDPREGALLHGLVLGVLRRQALLDAWIAAGLHAPARPHRPRGAGRAAHRRVRTAVPRARPGLRRGGQRGGTAQIGAAPGCRGLRQRRAARPGAKRPVGLARPGAARRRGGAGPPPVPSRLVGPAAGAADRLGGVGRPAAAQQRAGPHGAAGQRPGHHAGPAAWRHWAARGSTPSPVATRRERCACAPGTCGAAGRWREGRAWVQDEAAQLVAFMLGRPLGRRVADLCAAPGGKTMQLAEWLPDDGSARRRRSPLSAGCGGWRPTCAGSGPAGSRRCSPTWRPRRRSRAGRSTRSCSTRRAAAAARCGGIRRSAGGSRRRTLSCWRRGSGACCETAAGLLAPGGRLVYSVCSMEPEEGERDDPRLPAVRAGPAAGRSATRRSPRRRAAWSAPTRFLRTSPADGRARRLLRRASREARAARAAGRAAGGRTP